MSKIRSVAAALVMVAVMAIAFIAAETNFGPNWSTTNLSVTTTIKHTGAADTLTTAFFELPGYAFEDAFVITYMTVMDSAVECNLYAKLVTSKADTANAAVTFIKQDSVYSATAGAQQITLTFADVNDATKSWAKFAKLRLIRNLVSTSADDTVSFAKSFLVTRQK